MELVDRRPRAMSRRSTDDRFLLNRVILGWATPIAWRGLFRPLTEEELPPARDASRRRTYAIWQRRRGKRKRRHAKPTSNQSICGRASACRFHAFRFTRAALSKYCPVCSPVPVGRSACSTHCARSTRRKATALRLVLDWPSASWSSRGSRIGHAITACFYLWILASRAVQWVWCGSRP